MDGEPVVIFQTLWPMDDFEDNGPRNNGADKQTAIWEDALIDDDQPKVDIIGEVTHDIHRIEQQVGHLDTEIHRLHQEQERTQIWYEVTEELQQVEVQLEHLSIQVEELDDKRGKAEIWHQVWQRLQQVEQEIEQLSTDIDDLENRKSATAAELKWADSQREVAYSKAEAARLHKKFKVLTDKKGIAEADEWYAQTRDQAVETRDRARSIALGLRSKPRKLTRLSEQRDNLYRLLRSMN